MNSTYRSLRVRISRRRHALQSGFIAEDYQKASDAMVSGSQRAQALMANRDFVLGRRLITTVVSMFSLENKNIPEAVKTACINVSLHICSNSSQSQLSLS